VALFLGGFTLLNLADSRLHPRHDGNLLWIDLRRLPAPSGEAVLALASALFLWLAARPRPARWRRWTTAGVTAVLVGTALVNAAAYWSLLGRGRFHAAPPLPLSVPVALLLLLVLVPLLRPPNRPPGAVWSFALALPLLAAGFPLAQFVFYGGTDYRRPADAIVVFGARAYADGRPSRALADRVRTGCELYRQGLAPYLVLSGGPGDGEVHETEAMRRLALDLGVPPEAILLDREGVDTRATVANTSRMLEDRGLRRLLAVSHDYHLARIKMAYGRAGPRVFTVPARETQVIAKMPYLVAREVVAFWVYWLRDAFR
jgi:uncharacterized SAM-binding protein YcdF (DUF218 family)